MTFPSMSERKANCCVVPRSFVFWQVLASALFVPLQLGLSQVLSSSLAACTAALGHVLFYFLGQRLMAHTCFWPKEGRLRFFLRSLLAVGASTIVYIFLNARLGLPLFICASLIGLGLLAGHLLMDILSWEILLYLIFGFLTTLVSILSFNLSQLLLYHSLQQGGGSFGWMPPKIISWLLAVIFAYLTNHRYVFHAAKARFYDFLHFAAARLVTGLVFEFFGLFCLVHFARMPRDLGNMLASILVVIANYFYGKYVVFQRTETLEQSRGEF